MATAFISASMRSKTITILAILLIRLPSAQTAIAGELERIESAHRPPTSPSSTSSSSTSSATTSSSTTSPPSRAREGSFAGPCIVLGPWTGYCLYGKSWLRADRGDAPESLVARAAPTKDFMGRPIGVDGEPMRSADLVTARAAEPDARRYGELHASTFLALRDDIWGFDAGARALLWVGGIDLQWLRLHEPQSAALDRLDLLHASAVGTLFAFRYVEAHILLGVDVLHGHDWTPAFGPGLEVRTYPWRRTTISGASRVSIFADGYPLLDSRLDAGLALGRIDLLLGCRWLFQAYQQERATNIVGPSVSLLVRLGP